MPLRARSYRREDVMFHFFFCAFGIELTIQMGLEMAFTLEHAPSAPQALRQAHLLRGKKIVLRHKTWACTGFLAQKLSKCIVRIGNVLHFYFEEIYNSSTQNWIYSTITIPGRGQTISEWIYEVTVSPKK